MSKYVSACNAFASRKGIEVSLVAGQEVELSDEQVAILPERTKASLKLIEKTKTEKVQKPA